PGRSTTKAANARSSASSRTRSRSSPVRCQSPGGAGVPPVLPSIAARNAISSRASSGPARRASIMSEVYPQKGCTVSLHRYYGAMADELRHVNLSSRQIRVLAHPLRARLVGELRLNGPATATRLAEVFHTNTGATSYHLRQLADIGMVEEDPEAGRGRERVWRAVHDVTSWERDDFTGDEDAQTAADWLTSAYASQVAERIEDWTRGVAGEP